MFRSLGHGGQENFCKCHDRGITPRNQICPVRSYSYHIWNCGELVLLSSSVLRETAIMASRILQDECSHWFSYKWFLLLLQYWSMKLKISRIYCNIPACFRERERERESCNSAFCMGMVPIWTGPLLSSAPPLRKVRMRSLSDEKQILWAKTAHANNWLLLFLHIGVCEMYIEI